MSKAKSKVSIPESKIHEAYQEHKKRFGDCSISYESFRGRIRNGGFSVERAIVTLKAGAYNLTRLVKMDDGIMLIGSEPQVPYIKLTEFNKVNDEKNRIHNEYREVMSDLNESQELLKDAKTMEARLLRENEEMSRGHRSNVEALNKMQLDHSKQCKIIEEQKGHIDATAARNGKLMNETIELQKQIDQLKSEKKTLQDGRFSWLFVGVVIGAGVFIMQHVIRNLVNYYF